MRPSDAEIEAAGKAALTLARELGLDPSGREVLHAGANISIRLTGTGIVARVVATVGRARRDGGRPDALRDLEVARYVAARGGPVVRPSTTPPAGPYQRDGRLIWLQEAVAVVASGWDEPQTTGRSLRELHDLLARPGAPRMPALPVWSDTRRWIVEAPELTEDERGWLAEVHAQAGRDIASLRLPEQTLHGDAHPGNLLVTAAGPCWTDFEETGRWPVEWDLACLLNAGVVLGDQLAERETMIRSYGRDPDDELLEPFHVARTVMATAWIALTGEYRGVPARDRLRARLAWLRQRAART